MDLLFVLLFSSLFLCSDEWLIVTGGGAVSSHVGGDVTLNCSVNSNNSSEKINSTKLKVQWKKVRGDVLVLLFENDKVQTDSTDESYRGRVQLFSSEETSNGNFSLRLKNIRAEDRGAYSCEVYSEEFSNRTTVELQPTGVSTLHIWMCVLCGGSVMSLLISFLVYKVSNQTEENSTAWVLISTLVVLPNVLLAAAFILWGQRDGSVSETLTCSALNLLRILFLLWISPYFHTFKVTIQNLMNLSVLLLMFMTLTINMCIDINESLAIKAYTAAATASIIWQGLQFMFMFIFEFFDSFHVLISGYLRKDEEVHQYNEIMFRFSEFFNWMRIIYIIQMLDPNPVLFSLLLIPLLPITWFYLLIKLKPLIWISGWIMWMIISTPVILYLHYHFLEKVEERTALIFMAAFIQVLNMMGPFDNEFSLSEGTHMVLWLCVSVVLVCVNAAALIIELILTTLNGEPTKHLRIILLISETLFTLICVILHIIKFFKDENIRRGTSLLPQPFKLVECLNLMIKQMFKKNRLNELISLKQLIQQSIMRRRRSSLPWGGGVNSA